LAAVVIYLDRTHDHAEALPYARRLFELEPDNQELRQMLDEPVDSEKSSSR
jgi:hypothetical protein